MLKLKSNTQGELHKRSGIFISTDWTEIEKKDQLLFVDSQCFEKVSSGEWSVADDNNIFEDKLKAWQFISGSIASVTVEDAPEPKPFAKPIYRTKLNATDSVIEIQPGTSQVIDFILTEERYISGGELFSENSEIGDYVTAEVYDVNGIIPEAYRASICENWPTVAKYIEKNWIGKGCHHKISTYPLNARISAGLSLRITYYACNSGNTRRVVMNYDLTKKL